MCFFFHLLCTSFAVSFKMKISLFIYLLVVPLMTNNEIFTAAEEIFKSFLSEKRCFPEDLVPLLNMTWNGNKIEVNQLLEPGGGNSETKYFFHMRGNNPKLRSNGVACMSVHNLSSISFSYNGLFLNEPVEFYFDHSAGNIKVLLLDLINGGKKSLQFSRMTSDELQVFEESNPDISAWKLTIAENKKSFIDGKLFTDCNLFEPFSDSACSFKILFNVLEYKLSWIANGTIQRSPDGERSLSARFHSNGGSLSSSFLLKAKWNPSFQDNFILSAEISSGSHSLILCKIYTTSVNSSWDLKIEIVSSAFDWQFLSSWNIQNESGRTISSVTEGNYLFRPSAMPIKYLFGFIENQSPVRVIDLRHNISSALYRFEGNMTVDLEPLSDSEPAVVTQISQKIRTSLERPMYLDLQQIFHKSGEWYWETVVMKSGLLNMHVNGLWNHSVLDLYKKQFHFHSHDEECFPSLNLAINYSDRLRFHHHAVFPFLARSYEILIEFTNPTSFFPMDFNILFRDEFKTNVSRSIARLNVFENLGILNAHASTEWLDIEAVTEAVSNQFKRVFSWIDDDQHPINKLLEPIFRRPTVSTFFRDLCDIVKL